MILRQSVVNSWLLVLLGFVGSATAQEPLRYRLDLRFAPADGILNGWSEIWFPREVTADGRLRLDISLPGSRNMNIERVSLSGGSQVAFSEPDAEGRVTLTLPAPAPQSVVIEYTLAVDSAMLQPYGYYIFAGSGPSGRAYPSVVLPDGNTPRFMDFDVTLTHPASMAVLTSGGHGTRHQTDAWVVAQYKAEHVEGFAIVAGEGFRVELHAGSGVPVVAFFHPSRTAEFAVAIQLAAEAATWYQHTYGFFPLRQIGIIQGHPRWTGGYALPNIFAIHLGTLTDDFLAFITAHELGHYYWGLHVLGDEERLDWVQLALGIWSDQLYLAERSGRPLEEQWRRIGNGDWLADYLTAVAAGYDQRLGLGSDEVNALIFDYNSLIRHGKAATAVYLQSLLLGPERFLELQRRLLQTYRFRPLPVAAFIAESKKAGLVGAPAFFAAWQRGDAVIGLSVDEVVPESTGGWRVVLIRTGPVPYPITVEVMTEDGATVRATVSAVALRDTIRIPTRPTAVRLDPDGVVPMWNSAHPEMRVLLARALDRASVDAQFLPLAREILADTPEEDHVRYRLTRKLYFQGRWEDASALWVGRTSCEGRDACMAGIYAARAMGQLGWTTDALARLDELRPGATAAGLLDFWDIVRREVRG